MKQEFKRLDGNKVRWEFTNEEASFEDQELGKLGVKGGYTYIVFDSKEQAMSVLDRDIININDNIDKYSTDMTKNEHNLEQFSQIKELVEAVGKMHNDFKDLANVPESLYANNPKKYQKLLREFNSAKDYIKEEMSEINKEYGKYINYKPAKQAYEFNVAQLKKAEEQKAELNKL